MVMDCAENGDLKWVQVRFVTKLQPPLKVSPTSIAIQSNLSRFGLSKVVNKLLKTGNPDMNYEPFDFLINGNLLRMPLELFLLAKGISAEKILEIEYIKSGFPRNREDTLHDDWVTAVDGSYPRIILTGCYDAIGRIWNEGKHCTHLLEGHDDAITSVSIIDAKEHVENINIATASKDRTLRLWKLDTEEGMEQPIKIRASKVLCGHNAAVQSVAAKPSGDMVCSGSWDCTINLWWANQHDSNGDCVSIKKRKVTGEVEESQLEVEAVSTFVGHTQCVSSVVWPQHSTIYSVSRDHSMRRWDVETGKDSWNIVGAKSFNCLSVGGEDSVLIGAGCSDPILRIWDPRKNGTTAPAFQFSSHSSWISACKWHDKSKFHLVSASYDGKVMLWDLRTTLPLAVINSHKDKVLCADWWKGDSVVSGGADSKLCVSSGIPVQ